MKYTKTAVFSAILAAALTLSACGKNNAPSDTQTTSSVTAAATEAAAAETSPEADNGAEDTAPDTDTDEAPDGDEERRPIMDFQNEDNPLRPLVEAAVAQGEWTDLAEVTDKEMIKDFFCVDLDELDTEEYIFMQCPMGILSELHIIRSSDVKAVKKALEARQEKAQNMDAFYPDDYVKADTSIVGTEGDYAYFIMSFGAADAETALVNAIKAK